MILTRLAFKNFRSRTRRPEDAAGSKGLLLFLLLFVLLCSPACNTVPPLPAIDLSDPGWRVTQGQAVWKRGRQAPELAADLLVATGAEGRFLVQFTKTPFPMLIAQSTGPTWELRVPLEKRRYSGRGRPPSRLIWLHLPELLAGAHPPKGWTWHQDGLQWRADNPRTGESLEGFFNR